MANLKAHLRKNGVLIAGCLIASNLLANEPEIKRTEATLPTPGVSIYGMGGNGWTAIGDAMAPLFGQPTRFFYVDPQFYYHSDQSGYTGSFGAGLRRLTDRAGILGAYVFGDYNRSTDGHNFWFVSPGIERLGQKLDFSVNGYIPVSSQRINTGIEFADQAGDTSQVSFSGHTEYDALVDTFTSTGYGADAQVGLRLPILDSEIYLGGYYFAPKDTNTVGGGAARLQVPINRYVDVLLSETYDNEYHNTLKAGFTVWLGGRHTTDGFHGDLVERMVDPIQRNLVTVAGGSHTGQPAVSDFADTGQTAIELQNISFFVPAMGVRTTTGTMASGDGTYEAPYIGMTQTNVDDANAQNNRNFYIESGIYRAAYGTNDPNYITLNNDQLYGRQNNFTKAAEGNARPVIEFSNGGFAVPAGDISDSFTGLQLVGASMDGHAGIWVDHTDSPLAQTIVINNTDVQSFGDGIDILNNSNSTLAVTLNNSWVGSNNGRGELFNSFQTLGGVAAVNANTGAFQFNLHGSTIANNMKSVGDPSIAAVGGLALVNTSNGIMTVGLNQALFTNNSVFMNNENNQLDRIATAGGVAATNASNGEMLIDANYAKFSGNTVSIANEHQQTEVIQAAGGLAAVNQSTGVMRVDANHSIFSKNIFSLSNASNFSQIQVDVLGGLAAANEDIGSMGININHSTMNENTFSVDTRDSGMDSIAAMGGLAALNNFSTGATIVNVEQSNFSENIFDVAGGGSINGDLIGGLAAANRGFEGGEMTVNIDHSTFSQNIISSNMRDGMGPFPSGMSFDAIGGLAMSNLGHDSTMTTNVSNSKIMGNTISLEDNSEFANKVIYAAGGMAVFSRDGTMNVDVNHTTISRNNIDFNDHVMQEKVDATGGLALASEINQEDGTMTVNVSHSIISQNTINALNFGYISSAGGLAGLSTGNGTMTLNVDDSTITQNALFFNDNGGSAHIDSAGGLAMNNFSGSGTLGLNISHSTISGNTAAFQGNTLTADTAGGLAIISSSSSPTTVSIDNSVITANSPGGIDLNGSGNLSMNLDHSTVTGNTNFALTADGGANVAVTNPAFFDGVVNALQGSTVTFPGLAPITSDNVHVICSPFEPCQIS